MAAKALPDYDVLHKLLRYEPESGTLYWRERPLDMFTASGRFTAEAFCRGWNNSFANKPALNCIEPRGYRKGAVFGVIYAAHRIIWKMETGQDPQDIDHINGCRSDNRFTNLRDVTGAENTRNAQIRSDNTSGHVGVCRSGSSDRWVASIGSKYIGSYRDIEDAIAARQAAETASGYHPNHGRTA